ncbi:MAG: hypothetical protein MI924_38545, partial [Chloroflexales bacterium]|nr:hypothetical protein [Chloroflexales bacterium]
VLLDVQAAIYDQQLEGEALRSMVLRFAARQHVRDVMVNGRWTVREGRSTMLDEAGLVAELRAQIAGQDRAVRQISAMQVQGLAPYLRRFYRGWNAPDD